jgi:hypothetical protein
MSTETHVALAGPRSWWRARPLAPHHRHQTTH